ncbi:hypothetical protein HDV00_009835 [Rhizophlyctis rosea]|nr:hypothetical protein HDV00_009835 [Rhizophlyctis rosea]
MPSTPSTQPTPPKFPRSAPAPHRPHPFAPPEEGLQEEDDFINPDSHHAPATAPSTLYSRDRSDYEMEGEEASHEQGNEEEEGNAIDDGDTSPNGQVRSHSSEDDAVAGRSPRPTITTEAGGRHRGGGAGLRLDFTGVFTEEPAKYLENHVFPVLLPGIEKLLRTVKRKDGQLEVDHVDPILWIAQYLCRNNPASQNAAKTRSTVVQDILNRGTDHEPSHSAQGQKQGSSLATVRMSLGRSSTQLKFPSTPKDRDMSHASRSLSIPSM